MQESFKNVAQRCDFCWCWHKIACFIFFANFKIISPKNHFLHLMIWNAKRSLVCLHCNKCFHFFVWYRFPTKIGLGSRKSQWSKKTGFIAQRYRIANGGNRFELEEKHFNLYKSEKQDDLMVSWLDKFEPGTLSTDFFFAKHDSKVFVFQNCVSFLWIFAHFSLFSLLKFVFFSFFVFFL